jgi:predicted transcriptional regulator
MAPIDEALEYLKSQEPGEKLSYRKVAEIFSISDTTLRRRHKGCQGSVEAKNQA